MSNSKIARPRFLAALTTALGVLALVPLSASAAITSFGSSLNHTPANAGSTCAENGVSGPTLCTHVASYFPGHSGRAASPVNGTIVAFQVRPQGPMTMTVHLVTVRHLSSNHKKAQAKEVSHGTTIHVPGPTQDEFSSSDFPIETFFVQIKVKKGQELAIDTSSNTAEYCSDGTPGQLLFDPALKFGQNFRNSSGVDGCLMLVKAIVEN